jgi:uncharacterized protein YkwD
MFRSSQPSQPASFILEAMRRTLGIPLLVTTLTLAGCGPNPSTSGRDVPKNPPGSSVPATPAPVRPAPKPVAPTTPPATPTLSAEASAALKAVNAARAQGRRCGETAYPAAPPVTWNAKLEAASRAHNADMIGSQYFDHVSPDGTRTLVTRAKAQGYTYSLLGENIAVGTLGSSMDRVAGAIQGWLSSPGHCQNVMNPKFTEIGMASATGSWERRTATFWTQEFGRPR